MENLVGRAQEAGYSALVVTVDTAGPGSGRPRDYKERLQLLDAGQRPQRRQARPAAAAQARLANPLPARRAALRDPQHRSGHRDGKPMVLTEMTKGGAGSHSPTWSDFGWLRDNWHGRSWSGSDHARGRPAGGRRGRGRRDRVQPRRPPARRLARHLTALPRIVEAIGDQAEVLCDSGIRRGSDVLKALLPRCAGPCSSAGSRRGGWPRGHRGRGARAGDPAHRDGPDDAADGLRGRRGPRPDLAGGR
ncbi:hypothetical protein L7F22_064675 [Adiantum nelumboides]|nr:hypothetical protein [Adiantum nelumboides]